MIERQLKETMALRAAQFPVLTITGPRQSGKTTLVRECFPAYDYVNLEDPATRELAERDYKRFLSLHHAPVIIDEIQRVPQLASAIQVMVDQNRSARGQFILTGSHQPLLHQTVSQSLAGRSAFLRLLPLSLAEQQSVLSDDRMAVDDCILRGGMPELAITDTPPDVYYRAYLQSYLERDVRQIANIRQASAFNRFLVLLAARTGQLLNLNSLSGEVGVSHTTLAEWLDVLEASFVVFRLRPYFANVGKRLVKTPKIYFSETGLAASLLGLRTTAQVSRDPLRGNLFENLVVSDILKRKCNRDEDGDLFFFRTSDGLEVDVLRRCENGWQPMEIKSSMTWSRSLESGLDKYRTLFPDAVSPMLVYAGDTIPATEQNSIDVRNYLEFD
jgi:predicted AAA+ superfamily ATPase